MCGHRGASRDLPGHSKVGVQARDVFTFDLRTQGGERVRRCAPGRLLPKVITFSKKDAILGFRPVGLGGGVRDAARRSGAPAVLYNDFGVARDVPGLPTMPSIDCTGCTGIVQACTGLYRFGNIIMSRNPNASRYD